MENVLSRAKDMYIPNATENTTNVITTYAIMFFPIRVTSCKGQYERICFTTVATTYNKNATKLQLRATLIFVKDAYVQTCKVSQAIPNQHIYIEHACRTYMGLSGRWRTRKPARQQGPLSPSVLRGSLGLCQPVSQLPSQPAKRMTGLFYLRWASLGLST